MTQLVTSDQSTLDCTMEATRQLIAACPTWQRLCGVQTAAAAAERVYLDSVPDINGKTYTKAQAIALRPFVVVEFDGVDDKHDGYTSGGPDRGAEDGKLIAFIQVNADTVEKNEPTLSSYSAWRVHLGMIRDELWERNGQSGPDPYLAVRRMRLDPPFGNDVTKSPHEGEWLGGKITLWW